MPNRNARPPLHVGLTPDAIATEALRIIDESGLGQFSMRRLAGELDLQHSALYWHFKNKTDLLAAVSAIVAKDIVPPREGLAWDDWLRRFAHNYRNAVLRHPNAAPLLASDLSTNSIYLYPAVAAMLDVLTDAGFRRERLRDVYNAFVGAIVGFVAVELSAAPDTDVDAWAEARRRDLELAAAELPVVAANADVLQDALVVRWRSAGEQPLDSSFDALVRLLIDGLRTGTDPDTGPNTG